MQGNDPDFDGQIAAEWRLMPEPAEIAAYDVVCPKSADSTQGGCLPGNTSVTGGGQNDCLYYLWSIVKMVKMESSNRATDYKARFTGNGAAKLVPEIPLPSAK